MRPLFLLLISSTFRLYTNVYFLCCATDAHKQQFQVGVGINQTISELANFVQKLLLLVVMSGNEGSCKL